MRMSKGFGRWILWALLTVSASGCATGPMTTVPWPNSPTGGGDQILVHFLHLEFSLPRSMIGRVLVLDLGLQNLSIQRNPDKPKEDIVSFGRMNNFWEIYEGLKKKGYFEGLDIHDAESFFDSLAVVPGEPVSEPVRFMREAYSVNDAEYTKSAKGPFTVYRAAAYKYPVASKLYILIEGDKDIYQVSGHISDSEYEALLSGLTRASVH